MDIFYAYITGRCAWGYVVCAGNESSDYEANGCEEAKDILGADDGGMHGDLGPFFGIVMGKGERHYSDPSRKSSAKPQSCKIWLQDADIWSMGCM